MCELVNKRKSVFEKAFLTLILLIYIQPFEDGNKRTSRVISNALFIAYEACPLSFRSMDIIAYRKAILLFYEKNYILALKRLFLEQVEFSYKNYF